MSDLSAVLAGAETDSWADRLLDALADFGKPLLLVLDDAHHLADEGCAAAVLRLARGSAGYGGGVASSCSPGR